MWIRILLQRTQANVDSAQLILVNSSGIPSYLHLKNYLIVDSFYLNQTQFEGKQSDYNETEAIQSNQCSIVIFFYNQCRFSEAAAPKFNALGRLFPQLYVIAIDAYYHYSVTIRFGISGVPSIYLLHNGRPVAKYNKTEITLDGLAEFIKAFTLIEPYSSSTNESNPSLVVIESDSEGPLVIVIENRTNYLLVFSWIFCLIVVAYYSSRSTFFHKIKDHIRIMWNEAQTVNHEHAE
ncbi:Thioredoxin domain-containing protein 15 [Sarcoptes scabiei]|uniref:Thioredoxin domain-containing protein 15 n=1 Tax=Sarcoptes scabiei TaxID=52283 RepID=A0A834R495_SARSC|nr:Thioredoxin domain-containing protein 15 [Sarcoptes scabiei]